MSENNTENTRSKRNKKKRKNKFNFGKFIKIFLITILILGVIGGGALGGIVLSMVKSTPEIDPSKINSNLSETSSILDLDGNLIEKIETAEFRTFVSIKKVPQHLQDAFIAIEDERFTEHRGIDPKGIIGSFLENFKADGIVRGASTITQQLVKNVYLTPEKKYSRKVQEAYLALKVDKELSKDQILEAYMNRNFFGQNAYGVQEAAQKYFSKDVGDLTIAESAVIAGIVKNIQIYQPFYRVKPEDFDSSKHYEVGDTDILGEKYILVFNEQAVERQRIILKKMLELGKINQSEYDQALKEDIKESLNPGENRTTDITSYFTDYVKTQVVDNLVKKQGYTKDQAEEMLYAGGLQIYTTVDLEMQKELEDVYENFTDILTGKNERAPILINWQLNSSGDILDKNKNKIVFYKEANLLDEDFNLVIEKGNYELLDNGDLKIKSGKLNPYPSHIDITDYYRIDDNKNLVTHTVGSIIIPEEQFSYDENKEIIISKNFLDSSEEFLTLSDNDNLLINSKYFYRDENGIVQPQSATVVLDYRTGHIKSLVGGRDVKGNRILNRATDSQRQPGSAIKPISTYLPALDNGYTAASALDDLPYFNKDGVEKPKNVYRGYRGIETLRTAVEISINTIAARTVENVGINNIKSYLEKMNIIDPDNPEADSFVTSSESGTNDENISALGLGGMTDGLTPLELTAAYGTIANDGIFIEPIAFTKVLDRDGNILIDNEPKETVVVSPQIAYVLKDILKDTVNSTRNSARKAAIPGMAVGGKTGTTQFGADIWFVGFTPYYVSGTWIGNDSQILTISRDSGTAASFWKYINEKTHTGLEKISSFARPDGIVTVNVCTQSGLLPTDLCKDDPRHVIRSEIFAKGTEPKTYCDIHVELEIDTKTNKIANEFCPEEDVETRVFVQRNPSYDPKKNKNIIPHDFKYSAPTEVCDLHDHTTVIEEPEEEEAEDEEDKDDNQNNELPDNNDKPGNNNNGNGKDEDEDDDKNNDSDKDNDGGNGKDKDKDKNNGNGKDD